MLPGMKKAGTFPNARVTAVELLDAMGCVVVGYDLGGWQIWSIAGSKAALQFTSTLHSNVYPVTNFCLMCPENDPHNILYMWVIHSAVEGISNKEVCPTTATMYQLRFKNKTTGSKPGVNDQYRRIENLIQSFHFVLSEPLFLGKESGLFQKLIDFESIQKINYMQGCNDFNGIVVSFESSKYIVTVLFDLNAWYFAQMPAGPNQVARLSPYIAYLPMEKTQIPSYCCLQAVKVKAQSLFRGKQSSSEACNVFPCSLNTIVQYFVGNNIINAFYFPTNELAIESGSTVEGLIELALKGVFTKHNTLVQSKKGKHKVIDFLRLFLPDLKKSLNDAMSPMLSGIPTGSTEIKKLRDLLTVTCHCICLGNKLKSVLSDHDGRIQLYQHTFQYVKTVLVLTDMGILPGSHNSLQDFGCKVLPVSKSAIGQFLQHIPNLDNLWEDGLYPPKSIRSLLNVFYTKPLDETLQVFVVSYSILHLNKDEIDLKKFNILPPEDADAINSLFYFDQREYISFIKYLPTKSRVFEYCDINVLCNILLQQNKRDVAKQMLLILDNGLTSQYSVQTMSILADTLSSEFKIDLISNGMANHIAFSSLLDEQLSHKQFASILKSLDGQERFDCLFYLILKKNKLGDLMSAYGEAQQFNKSSSKFLEFLFLYTIKHFSDIELKACLTGNKHIPKDNYRHFNKAQPLSSQECQNDISVLSRFCTKTDLGDFKLGSSPNPTLKKKNARVLKTPPPKCPEVLDNFLQQLRTPHPTPMREKVINDLEAPRSILRSSKTERKNRKRIRFDDPGDEFVSSSQPTRLSFGGVDFNESSSEIIPSPSKRLLFDEDMTSHEGVSLADISPPKPLIESVVRYDATAGADQQIPLPIDISGDSISFNVGNSHEDECIETDKTGDTDGDSDFRFSPVPSPIKNTDFDDLFGNHHDITQSAESIDDSFVSAASDQPSVGSFTNKNVAEETTPNTESAMVFNISDDSIQDLSVHVTYSDDPSELETRGSFKNTSSSMSEIEVNSSVEEVPSEECSMYIKDPLEDDKIGSEGEYNDDELKYDFIDEISDQVDVNPASHVDNVISVDSSSDEDQSMGSAEDEIALDKRSKEIVYQEEDIADLTDVHDVANSDETRNCEENDEKSSKIIPLSSELVEDINKQSDDKYGSDNDNHESDHSDGSIKVIRNESCHSESEKDDSGPESSCNASDVDSVELIPEPNIEEDIPAQEVLNSSCEADYSEHSNGSESIQVIGVESDSQSQEDSGTDNGSTRDSSSCRSECSIAESCENDQNISDDQDRDADKKKIGEDIMIDHNLEDCKVNISSTSLHSPCPDVNANLLNSTKDPIDDTQITEQERSDYLTAIPENRSCPISLAVEDSGSEADTESLDEEESERDSFKQHNLEEPVALEPESPEGVDSGLKQLEDIEMVDKSAHNDQIKDVVDAATPDVTSLDTTSLLSSTSSALFFEMPMSSDDKHSNENDSFVSAAGLTDILETSNDIEEPESCVGEILELVSDDSEDDEIFTFEPPEELASNNKTAIFPDYDKISFDFSKPHVAPRLTRAQAKKNKVIGSKDSVILDSGGVTTRDPKTPLPSIIPASVFNMATSSPEITSITGSISSFSPRELPEEKDFKVSPFFKDSLTGVFGDVSVPKYELQKAGEGYFRLQSAAAEILELSGDTASLSGSEFQSFIDDDVIAEVDTEEMHVDKLKDADTVPISCSSNYANEEESDETESIHSSNAGNDSEMPKNVSNEELDYIATDKEESYLEFHETLEASEELQKDVVTTSDSSFKSLSFENEDNPVIDNVLESSESAESVPAVSPFEPMTIESTQLTIAPSIPSPCKALQEAPILSKTLPDVLMISELIADGSDSKSCIMHPQPPSSQTMSTSHIELADIKPAAVKSADVKSTDFTRAGDDSADVEINNAESADVKISNSESTDIEISNAESTDVEISNAESADIEISNAETTDIEISYAESTNAEKAYVEGIDVEPVYAELADAGSSDDESAYVKSTDVKSFDDESPDVELAIIESADVELANVELSDLESDNEPTDIVPLTDTVLPNMELADAKSADVESTLVESAGFESDVVKQNELGPCRNLRSRKASNDVNVDYGEHFLTTLELQPPPKILQPRRLPMPVSQPSSSTHSRSSHDTNRHVDSSESCNQSVQSSKASASSKLKPDTSIKDKRPYKILRPPRTLRSQRRLDKEPEELQPQEEDTETVQTGSVTTDCVSRDLRTRSKVSRQESSEDRKSELAPDSVADALAKQPRSRTLQTAQESEVTMEIKSEVTIMQTSEVKVVASPKNLRTRSKVIKEDVSVKTTKQETLESDKDNHSPKIDEAIPNLSPNFENADSSPINLRKKLRSRTTDAETRPSKGKMRPRKQTNSESNTEEKPASKVRKSESLVTSQQPEITTLSPVLAKPVKVLDVAEKAASTAGKPPIGSTKPSVVITRLTRRKQNHPSQTSVTSDNEEVESKPEATPSRRATRAKRNETNSNENLLTTLETPILTARAKRDEKSSNEDLVTTLETPIRTTRQRKALSQHSSSSQQSVSPGDSLPAKKNKKDIKETSIRTRNMPTQPERRVTRSKTGK